MSRCHGCFNLMAYCNCAETEVFMDPETGEIVTRHQLDVFLNMPPRFEPSTEQIDFCHPAAAISAGYIGPLTGFEDWAQMMIAEVNAVLSGELPDGW